MLISGIEKFSLIDFPDILSCIVFTPGCNFRCGFCHNAEFVLPECINKLKQSFIPEQVFFNFLEKRRNKLEGVVICGGEPTLMPDLPVFIEKIKKMGFLVKLDTNGHRPEILENLIDNQLLDYIAMDIKTSMDNYSKLTGVDISTENIKKSIEIIKNSGIEYEFRTTLIKEIHTNERLAKMLELIKGSKRMYFQKFLPKKTLNKRFSHYHSFNEEELKTIKNQFEKDIGIVGIR